jgi:hypothetical protein
MPRRGTTLKDLDDDCGRGQHGLSAAERTLDTDHPATGEVLERRMEM